MASPIANTVSHSRKNVKKRFLSTVDIRTSKVEKKDQQILLVAKYITVVMNVWLGIFFFFFLLNLLSYMQTLNLLPQIDTQSILLLVLIK